MDWHHFKTSANLKAAALVAAISFSDVGSAEIYAYITNQKDDSVSVIDTATNTVIKTLKLKPGSEPAGVAVSGDGSRVVISNPTAKSVTVIDGRTQAILDDISVGTGPLGIAIDAKGKRAYAADWYENYITVIDLDTRRLTNRIPVGHSPAGVVLNQNDTKLYVANRDDNSISEIDTRTEVLTRTVRVGRHPFGICLTADGQKLYSANVESNDISIVDAKKMEFMMNVRVGERPYAIALANGFIFVTTQYDDALSVIDPITNKRLGNIKVGGYPEGIAAHPNEKLIYVANWFTNDVSVINTKTMESLARISTGNGSRAFGTFITRFRKLSTYADLD